VTHGDDALCVDDHREFAQDDDIERRVVVSSAQHQPRRAASSSDDRTRVRRQRFVGVETLETKCLQRIGEFVSRWHS
jgi:hypothetical protein